VAIKGPMPGDRHQPASNIVGLGPSGNLGIECSGLLLQVAERTDEHREAVRLAEYLK
jgi:hypothetical protein